MLQQHLDEHARPASLGGLLGIDFASAPPSVATCSFMFVTPAVAPVPIGASHDAERCTTRRERPGGALPIAGEARTSVQVKGGLAISNTGRSHAGLHRR